MGSQKRFREGGFQRCLGRPLGEYAPVVQAQIPIVQGLLCGNSSEKAPHYRDKGPGVQAKRWPNYRYCFSCLKVRGGSRPSKRRQSSSSQKCKSGLGEQLCCESRLLAAQLSVQMNLAPNKHILNTRAKKEPQSQRIARTAPKNFLNNSRALASKTRVLRQIAPESSPEKFGKIFVTKVLWGTFSVPD